MGTWHVHGDLMACTHVGTSQHGRTWGPHGMYAHGDLTACTYVGTSRHVRTWGPHGMYACGDLMAWNVRGDLTACTWGSHGMYVRGDTGLGTLSPCVVTNIPVHIKLNVSFAFEQPRHLLQVYVRSTICVLCKSKSHTQCNSNSTWIHSVTVTVHGYTV